MAKKNNTVARLEFVVIIIFFIGFIIWATGQCSRKQAIYQAEDERAALIDSLDNAELPPAPRPQRADEQQASANTDTIGSGNLRIIRERVLPLYITIDGLNIRRGPGLNYDVIDRLGLYEEVSFLDEVTNSLDTIKLGSITAAEPWVKVRTPKGKVGWVYGAGVSYYKKKLEGMD